MRISYNQTEEPSPRRRSYQESYEPSPRRRNDMIESYTQSSGERYEQTGEPSPRRQYQSKPMDDNYLVASASDEPYEPKGETTILQGLLSGHSGADLVYSGQTNNDETE
mgnify:CR=1 FL=1